MTPSYLFKVRNADGSITYRYNPPADAVAEGVVKRVAIGKSFEEACAFVEKQNAIVDEWRKERKYLKNLTTKSTIDSLIKSYLNSNQFNNLGDNSKEQYQYYLKCWYKNTLGGVPLLKARLGNIVTPMCQRVYDEHASNSVSLANHTLAIYRLLFNHAIRSGFTNYNPFEKVKTERTKTRKIVWERQHIRAFLNTAFSRFEWRNVGVIVYMAYEWGQRLGDMRRITWDNIDLENGVMSLTQSKRGANISVPISTGLLNVLKQQHVDFGWQSYVAPKNKLIRKKLLPYSDNLLYRTGSRIMEEANLPSELSLMDLRRTAITEMVEVGVPLPSIMAMSGHATPSSLTPYIKHTLRGAKTAQSMRDFPQELL